MGRGFVLTVVLILAAAMFAGSFSDSSTGMQTLPTPPHPSICGNKVCESDETQNSCLIDCVNIIHYKFDESFDNILLDSSIFVNNDGIIHGATLTQGYDGHALNFDGVNDYVEVSSNVFIGVNEVTITFWFKADSVTGCGGRFISKAIGDQTEEHEFMVSVCDGKLRSRLKTSGTTSTFKSGSITTNVWTHAAMVYDGNSIKHYIDGSMVGSTAKTGMIDVDNTMDTWIGGNPDGSNHFVGKIDDLRIYDSALSYSEVINVMNSNEEILDVCGDGIVTGNEVCDNDYIPCIDALSYEGIQHCSLDCSNYGECISQEYCGDGICNGEEYYSDCIDCSSGTGDGDNGDDEGNNEDDEGNNSEFNNSEYDPNYVPVFRRRNLNITEDEIPNYVPRFKKWYLKVEKSKMAYYEEILDEDEIEVIYVPPEAPEFIKGGLCKDEDEDGFPLKTFRCNMEIFDCNDKNSKVYPGAPELCDGLDTDCNGFLEDNYAGDGCIPDFTTAYLPIEEGRWSIVMQSLKNFFRNPPIPEINEVIFDKTSGELKIYGKNFYTKPMEKGVTTHLLIGTIEGENYQNAYNYEPLKLEEDSMSIFFQNFPSKTHLWIQVINVLERNKDYTSGNVFKTFIY